MRRWILFLGFVAVTGGGCTTVGQESRKAREVAVSTGGHIEEGWNAARGKTRSWWQRMFGSREVRPAPPEPNSRYQTAEPQYVGVEPGG